MIGNSDGVEEEWQRKSLKAEVELPHRRREFEPEDERHPGSGGLSRKHLTYAGVRVGDPANTEGMNEGGREPEVQRKSRKKAKVKVRKRKRMKKFRNPNAGGCENGADKFRRFTEAGNAETKAAGGDATTCVFATRSILANRKIRKWMVIFPSTNVGARKPGSSSDNGNGRKGEGKPDGMPGQLPEEGTEGTEDAGKDSGKEKVREAEVKTPEVAEDVFAVQCNPGTLRRKLREMAEVQGYAGNVKSEKDRPGGESEVDFTCRKFAGTNRRIRPKEPIVPEVVYTNPSVGSRGGSELVKGPEEDELAE
ncbi:hypothetical protein K438DRAFT_1752452 [Mycena galopus ATCC 62051]|nr:hypothetical protein K438DRAFT_1752452 [Mycena galopus ATCC 62051]